LFFAFSPRLLVICQPPALFAQCASLIPQEDLMSTEPVLTQDVIGLIKPAPVSRRGFMTASAAVTAGYTLAAEINVFGGEIS